MDSGKRAVRGTDRQAELSVNAALHRYMALAPLPFAITRGAEHTLVYANAAFCRLAGLANDAALGAPVANAFTGEKKSALGAILDHAFAGAVELVDACVGAEREGGTGWKCAVWPVVASDGRSEGLGIELRETERPDATLDLQRQVAEQMLLGALRERGLAEDAEAARRRAAFLAETGRLLAESVDQSSTLVALTKLALPELGAWCIVDILEENGAIRRLGIYHSDSGKQTLANGLSARWNPDSGDLFGAAAMLRSTSTVAITEGIEEAISATPQGVENLDILRQLGIGAFLTVPLLARGKLLGAITFVAASHQEPYQAAEVQLAEDIGYRAGLALDNAQVHEMALVLREDAETANNAKTAFLGAMSHELRTPLNAIGGYIDLLEMGLRGPITKEQRADLARVKTNQQHLTVLITEILNFARAASSDTSYAVTEINVVEAMTHAIGIIEPLFAKNGLVFDGVSGDASIVASADPERVTQVLVNLLANAIKFTPADGHISTDCSAAENTVTIRITDTGIGIAPNKLDTIFEPFIQLKESFSGGEGGIGLGLAISRDLARGMKGDLSVESTEGKGSCFTLTLPRATSTGSEETSQTA